jgi:hypothetical protein
METIDSYRNGDEGVISPLLIKAMEMLGGEIEVANEEIYGYEQQYVVDAYCSLERNSTVYKLRRIKYDTIDGEVVDKDVLPRRALGSGGN